MDSRNKLVKCVFCTLTVARTDNLGRHIERFHKEFLELRMKHECIELKDVKLKTVKEHCNNLSVPEVIFNKYMKQFKPIIYFLQGQKK